jgi:hypothetical protein
MILQQASGFDASLDGGPFLPPITDGLVYWGFLGGSKDASVYNHAPGQTGLATVLGAPTYSTGYAGLQGGVAQFATLAPDTSDQTILVVAQDTDTDAAAATRPFFVSNFNSPAVANASRSATGVSLYVTGTGIVTFSSARWDGTAANSGAINLSGNTLSQWNYFEAYCSNTQRQLRNRTQSLVINTPASIARDPGTATYRIGGNAVQTTGKSNIALVAIYSRVLASAELDQLYATIKAIMALRGIVV